MNSRTEQQNEKKEMTNGDGYCSSPQMVEGDGNKKKEETVSDFLYLDTPFVVCFVRVLLMLVFKMCGVSPADAVG